MTIKQRKQLTGTTAQINAYAGVEGQLVWDKTKKKWVGMSGTAGTNYPMASESHTHSISNVTGLQTALDDKLGATAKAASARVADSANSVDWNNVSNKPTIPSGEGVYVTESGSSDDSWWRKWSNGMIEQKIYLKTQTWNNKEFSVIKPLTTLLSSCVSVSYTQFRQKNTYMHSHFVQKNDTAYFISPYNKDVDSSRLTDMSYNIYILGS